MKYEEYSSGGMRANLRKIFVHFALALGLATVLFLLFTYFPRRIPHPEDISALVYFVAALASLLLLLLVRKSVQRKPYMIIALLTVLAFLDEISYGVELGLVEPLYWARHNAYIYDIHNLIGLSIELTQIWLARVGWNSTLFNQFLRFDGILLVTSTAFFWLLRNLPSKDRKKRTFIWLALFIGGNGLLAIASLISIPGDPRNAWLLGFSPLRWGLILMLFALSALPTAILTWRKAFRVRYISQISTISSIYIQRVAGLAILLGLAYQMYTLFLKGRDLLAIIERANPLVGWALLSAALAWITLHTLKGRATKPIRAYVEQAVVFLASYPASIYTGVGLVLILLAQINDKGWLPFSQYLAFPPSEISNPDLFTEEILETAAAFELILGSLIGMRDRKG